jgi:hypothetical protein
MSRYTTDVPVNVVMIAKVTRWSSRVTSNAPMVSETACCTPMTVSTAAGPRPINPCALRLWGMVIQAIEVGDAPCPRTATAARATHMLQVRATIARPSVSTALPTVTVPSHLVDGPIEKR